MKLQSQKKPGFHIRNKHQGNYPFEQLVQCNPDLAAFVKLNDYKVLSIDFANPEAVLMLNKTLLKYYYGIENWNIPKGYLCPPIPGRADYIHHVADLMASVNQENIPTGNHIRCLDIGVGANCIYPIIGNMEYGWSFVGSDIEQTAIDAAIANCNNNPKLQNNIEIRLQPNPKNILTDIIKNGELFDITICNPPFHASAEEAMAGSLRKVRNLKNKRISKPILNFGGTSNELWCEGGEEAFVSKTIAQSRDYFQSCLWFTTLISKEANLQRTYAALNDAGVTQYRTLALNHGNKTGRIVAWSFLSKADQKKWVEQRWKSF